MEAANENEDQDRDEFFKLMDSLAHGLAQSAALNVQLNLSPPGPAQAMRASMTLLLRACGYIARMHPEIWDSMVEYMDSMKAHPPKPEEFHRQREESIDDKIGEPVGHA